MKLRKRYVALAIVVAGLRWQVLCQARVRAMWSMRRCLPD